MLDSRPPLPDGYDRVGPLHPYVAWAAVLVVDLICLCLILAVVAMIGDSIEDALWPGGFDWIRAL